MNLVHNPPSPAPPATTTTLDTKGAQPGPFTTTFENSPASAPPQTTQLVTTGVHRRDYDPYGDFNFIVEIDGVPAGAFQKCDGLSYECDVIEYRDSLAPWGRKRRGQTSHGNIKLVKGYTTSSALWDWCGEIMSGEMGRKTGAIHLLADDGDGSSPIVTYRWVEGFPCKWTGFRFDGKSSGAHLVEEIEIAVEAIFRD